MSLYDKLRGTIETLWRIGLGGPQLKNSSGAIESRNVGDTDYAIHRHADPVAANDGVTRQFFYIEHANPRDPLTYTYDLAYDATGSPQAANEIQYTRVWISIGRVITKMRTHITTGANGTRQIQYGIYIQAVPTAITDPAATTIAAGSNGAALPQATINVASIAGFPTSGTVFVTTSGGVQTVTYTGLGASSFTGCAGGTGTMSTGGAVSTLARVATTAANTPPNLTTGQYDVNLTGSYTVLASGFYWLAIQLDNGTMAFTVSPSFRADSIKRREETTGGFALPALAGATTSPQSAVIYVSAVE